jgi:hypothetical protein
MAGHPARIFSVRCAVSRSGGGTCEKSLHGSLTATTSATSVTPKMPSQYSSIRRERHDVVETQSVDSAQAASRFPPGRGAAEAGRLGRSRNLDLHMRPETLASRVGYVSNQTGIATIAELSQAAPRRRWNEPPLPRASDRKRVGRVSRLSRRNCRGRNLGQLRDADCCARTATWSCSVIR